jgi:arabinofuranosyltransferase
LIPLGIITAILMALGFTAHPNTFEVNSKSSDHPNTARTRRGVTDERTLLFETGLVKSSRIDEIPSAFWWERQNPKKSVEAKVVLGYRGLVGGPDVHWIDLTALSDPLLARLPATHRPDWMAGHFHRAIPEGYRETLETGENVIKNPGVAELYRRLDLVVHGDLWSLERLEAIWWLNTGGPEEVINEEMWRYKGATRLKPSQLAWRVDDATVLDKRKLVYEFGQVGLYVKFGERQYPKVLELSVSGHDRFVMVFYDGLEEIARVDVPRRLIHRANGVVARHIEIPELVTERGFTRLRVLPKTKRQAKRPLFVVGHLLFDDDVDTARPVAERPAPKPKADKANAGPQPEQPRQPEPGPRPRPDPRPEPDLDEVEIEADVLEGEEGGSEDETDL